MSLLMNDSAQCNLYSAFLFETQADKTLLTLASGETYTYADIDKKVSQLCHAFKKMEIVPGDRVMQQTEKSLEAFCVYLASLKYGTIYIPLNPAFQREELAYFIQDADPALCICTPEKKKTIVAITNSASHNIHVKTLATDGTGSLTESLHELEGTFDTAEKVPSDIACILYTSGTTGKPKGAMLSHHNLLNNAQQLVIIWGFTEDDTLLHMLPIFHCHGLFFACHCVLLSGAKMIFMPKFDAKQALTQLPNSTVMMGVPTYYTRLLSLEDFGKIVSRNMRLFISGSAPLLESTFNAFAQKTRHKILERYGMTETGINTSNPLVGDRRPGTVGMPLNELKIVDDKDNEVIGKPGHVLVRGENVFSGYWQNLKKTQESFTADGFFRTGDIAIKNQAGYVTIVGRAKDMIISGGLNVYPKEVESIIDRVKGVKESAVIGVPHSDFGEGVIAVVAVEQDATLSSDIITSKLRDTIASYKTPKKIYFVEELPKNTMGKVQKNILREKHKAVFESTEPLAQ